MENQNLETTPSASPQAEQHHAHSPKQRERRLRRNALVAALGIGLCLLAWNAYETSKEQNALKLELQHRLAEASAAQQEARAQAKQNKDSLDQLQARFGSIEARQLEAQGQFATLEAMYTEFSRARDERALSEVDQALNIAEQQLQLAGNVPAAISALQSADSRLADMDQARLLPLRKQIARDIEQLRALPIADITSIALKLETQIERLDGLPLAFERTIPSTKARSAEVGGKSHSRGASKKAQPEPVQSMDAEEAKPSLLARFFKDIRDDFSALIRIERIDGADPSLLAPDQALYLRENLRLRLLSARLALLQRDSRLFAEDIRQSIAWLNRYFDTKSRPVAELVDELHRIESAQLVMALPTLNEAHAALRGLKPSPARR